MLKIGDFSKLSRVSIRMLRHYDKIGLLRPVEIDPFTGYRYYSEEQLLAAGRITALKDMGFQLSVICEILRCSDDSERLEGYLHAREAELETLLHETAYRLRLLETARERLRKEHTMNYEVTVKTLPQRCAACLRTTIPSYAAEGTVWNILCGETDPLGILPANPCLRSVTFLDGEYKETDVEVEAQKTVQRLYPDTEHVRFRVLPPVTFASATYKGPYSLVGEVNAAVAAWVSANGYDYAGPMFNIYHVSPYETQDPEEFVTEVCYPVTRK